MKDVTRIGRVGRGGFVQDDGRAGEVEVGGMFLGKRKR